MALFNIAGKTITLPAVEISPRAKSDQTAWQSGKYVTVRFSAPVAGIRVHTDGKAFPGRPASAAMGAWVAIGDVIQTAPALANSRSLPSANPQAMTAFTHTSDAVIPPQCVVNIGVASAKFGGAGGGFQAEYVSGPLIQFTPLPGKHWHGQAGHA